MQDDENSSSEREVDQRYLTKHIEPDYRDFQDVVGDPVSEGGQQGNQIHDLRSGQQPSIESDSGNLAQESPHALKSERNSQQEPQKQQIQEKPKIEQHEPNIAVRINQEADRVPQQFTPKYGINAHLEKQDEAEVQKVQKKSQPIYQIQEKLSQQYLEYALKMRKKNQKSPNQQKSNKLHEKITSEAGENKQEIQAQKVEKNKNEAQNILSNRRKQIEFDQQVFKKQYERSLNVPKKVQEKPYCHLFQQEQPRPEKSLKQINCTSQVLKAQLKSTKEQIVAQVDAIIIQNLQKQKIFIKEAHEKSVEQIQAITKVLIDERMIEYQSQNSKEMQNIKNLLQLIVQNQQKTLQKIDSQQKQIQSLTSSRQTNQPLFQH